jgi:ribosomal protein L16 Arg81 hydroxylase
MTEEQFLGLLRRREFAYWPGSRDECLAPLIGWQALRHMIETGNYPKRRNDFRVTRESHFIGRDRWSTEGKADVAKLDQLLANGFSIVLNHFEEHVPVLAALCDDIKSATLDGADTGVIVTSGVARGAFKLHFDPADLITLQVEGTKRWKLFAPAVVNPLNGMPAPPPPDSEPVFDEVIEPGDLLFVPGGNWHHCECGLSTSVHLGISFMPPTGWHVMNDLTERLLSEDWFRTPLTRLGDTTTLEAMEAELRSRLIDKIGALNISDFVADWHKIAY